MLTDECLRKRESDSLLGKKALVWKWQDDQQTDASDRITCDWGLWRVSVPPGAAWLVEHRRNETL